MTDTTYTIPPISTERLETLRAKMRPVIRTDDGRLHYIERVDPIRASFLWDRIVEDEATGLEVLGEVETLHTYAYYGFFKPTEREVISQLPETVVGQVVAFEVSGPQNADDLNKHIDQLNAGFHVAKTILYRRAPPAVPWMP